MDVYNMYLGDCVSYSSMRNPIYRDYEKYPYGSMESSLNSKTKNYYNSGQAKKVANKLKSKEKTTKASCPFCQEQKKRPLGVYLRKREMAKRNDSIMEEDDDVEDDINEEEEEEEDDNENEKHEHGHEHSHEGNEQNKKQSESEKK